MSRLTNRSGVVVALLVVVPSVVLANGLGGAGESPRVAHFHLSGALVETPREMPFAFPGAAQATSLKQIVKQLRKAREDDSVKAIVLTYGGMQLGLGQLEEVHSELMKFRAVDKRVFVHSEGMTTGVYALLSSASDLAVVPTADVWLSGLHVESPYIKGLLAKIGAEADIEHMGAYKSAGEMLTNDGPSDSARENTNWLLDGLYGGLVRMIAESRGLSEERVRSLIDDGPYTAEQALKAGLVDSVQYRDEFLTEIKKIYGEDIIIDNNYGAKKALDIDFSNPFAFFSVVTEMFSPRVKKHKDSIGIVYVEGTIVTGHAQPSPFGAISGAFSGDIRRALDMAADDDSVKAVVLRVDSPGGSALASEIILHATERVKAKKPLIVSMGNVAGSGGYYVACAADAILADETTITGSIGVVGGKIVTSGMWDKLGVHWSEYKRGENSDLLSTARRFDEQQRARFVGWMETIYEVFKGHVVKHRGDKLSKPIDELAGGRVFTGRQAMDNGLVDKIGGLSDAIEYAARKASIADYEVRVIPEPKSFLDTLMSQLSGDAESPADLAVPVKLRLFAPRSPLLGSILPALQRIDPLRVKAVMQALTRLELIHDEGVITMMPETLLVR